MILRNNCAGPLYQCEWNSDTIGKTQTSHTTAPVQLSSDSELCFPVLALLLKRYAHLSDDNAIEPAQANRQIHRKSFLTSSYSLAGTSKTCFKYCWSTRKHLRKGRWILLYSRSVNIIGDIMLPSHSEVQDKEKYIFLLTVPLWWLKTNLFFWNLTLSSDKVLEAISIKRHLNNDYQKYFMKTTISTTPKLTMHLWIKTNTMQFSKDATAIVAVKLHFALFTLFEKCLGKELPPILYCFWNGSYFPTRNYLDKNQGIRMLQEAGSNGAVASPHLQTVREIKIFFKVYCASYLWDNVHLTGCGSQFWKMLQLSNI